MKYLLSFFLLIFFGCAEKPTLTNNDILEKGIHKHDPNKKWKSAKINVRIQEPRVQNPKRYSIVKLNNENGSLQCFRTTTTNKI